MALIRSLIHAFSEDPSLQGLFWAAQSSGVNVDSPTGRQVGALTTNLQALKTVVLTNDYLIRNHIEANMFATAFFGLLDPHSGLLTYINAGHNPPMIRRAAGPVERLQPTGPALGMFPGTSFVYAQAQLDLGDTLYAFTDGVTEARDPTGAFFTEAPLLQLLLEPVTSASALTDQVMTQLRAHIADADQFDDITMLTLYRSPTP
jgi:sigma-B regulation protein RsbU (phosphoserine phosphatase)